MRLLWVSGLSVILLASCLLRETQAQVTQNNLVTINQAVQEAIDKNLGLIAERYNLTMADAQIITARLRTNPVLSLDADHLDLLGTHYNNQNSGGPPEYSIRTDYTFERGGKRERRIEVAEDARAVVELQLLNTIRTLAFDVESAFVDVQLAKDNLTLAQDNLRLFNEVVEISAARVRAGDLAQIELTRSRVAALQFKNALLQAEMKLRLAKNRLQLLMGRTIAAATFDIVGDLRRDGQFQTTEIAQIKAVEMRPDRQALVRDQARSAANLRLQLAQGKVDYTFGMEYRRQQGLAGRGNSLGFFFSVPIPLFNRNQGEVERVRQEDRQLEAKLFALDADIKNEVESAYQQCQAARTLLDSLENGALDQAHDVYQTMEYSYRHGEASFVELIDAQRAFNDTKQSYNEARAEYARSLYMLDSAVGQGVNP